MNHTVQQRSVGFLGLGKLGLPCAAAYSVASNSEVFGFDLNPSISEYLERTSVPYLEKNIETYLARSQISLCESIDELVDNVDVLFLAVQTPHEPRFEGSSPVPTDTSDFDYSFLVNAMRGVVDALLERPGKELLVVVISTVLPGTMRRLVFPLIPGELESQLRFAYNPFFIAMGTTVDDYLHPEFVLIGADDPEAANELEDLYSRILDAPIRKMSIESAELTKVAYNTFIGFKIIFANAIGEIVDRLGGNSDEVTDALGQATTRLMSPKYLSSGMADGGGCHPRDQIAMSWLAQHYGLSANIFDMVAKSRDLQTEAQAKLITKIANDRELPVVILGKAYKANTNLTVGSPSLLLSSFLRNSGTPHSFYDPVCEPGKDPPQAPSLFFIATNHDVFKLMDFPSSSVVIDPWGYVTVDDATVELIRPGRRKAPGV